MIVVDGNNQLYPITFGIGDSENNTYRGDF